MFSFHKVFGDDLEHETPAMYESTPNVEDMINDGLLLKDLLRQIDEIIPNGANGVPDAVVKLLVA